MMKRVRQCAAACLAAGMLAPAAWAEGVSRDLPVQILGVEFNYVTVFMTFLVACLVCLGAWLCTRRLTEVPGRGQVVMELLFGVFDSLVTQSIGRKEAARKYLPWIGSLFMFIWLSNMIGMIPVPHTTIGAEGFHDYNFNHVYDPGEFASEFDTNGNGVHDSGFVIPAFEEPTKDYNVPGGMALLFVILIGHGGHMRKHGVLGYLKSYIDPGGLMGLVMMPLNIVGKIAEFVSISFRLFGNIFGGAVILVVVSGLIQFLVFPIGLLAFFGVFVGTVQAFVFTMLALTYISLGVGESGGDTGAQHGVGHHEEHHGEQPAQA